MLVLSCVRFSVTKIPSLFCLSCFLFEYTWFLTRYDRNQTITCDFPSFTFLITWLRPMSFIDNSIPSLSLHIFITKPSVFTGWRIWPRLSTGTRTLWNLRFVRREYCSWLSNLDSSSAIVFYYDSNSASCSWIVFSFRFTCLSSLSSQIYCLHIFSLFESMVFCWLSIASFIGATWVSKHFLISSSIRVVSASPIFPARTGTILSNASGLVRVSRILSVTFVFLLAMFFYYQYLWDPILNLNCVFWFVLMSCGR